ncbi:MAG: hypothetical protein GXO57_06160 [Thermodesulfobacteria bacterium]|nr:hypothetical protein [Thermodesulfobacteriota bacterium]
MCLLLWGCKSQRFAELKSKVGFYYTEVKDKVVERTKVALKRLPIIGNHISLPPAPKELYLKTKEVLDKLKMYKTEELYPKEYSEVVEKWEEAQDDYLSEYYLSAKKELSTLYPEAKRLLEKVKEHREKMEKRAWKKYEEVYNKLKPILEKAKGKTKLKIKLYLWKLRLLIKMENYDDFYRAIRERPF